MDPSKPIDDFISSLEAKDDSEKQNEVANVTTVTTQGQQVQDRDQSFYFDTACTSHMTPFVGRIKDYAICSGTVKSSSKASMPIKGQGHVMMECELSDGTVSKFKFPVPALTRPLLS
jgi:hypothetical protein